MRNTQELLKRLTLEFPPESGTRHAITLELGRVCINIALPSGRRPAYLDEGDLDKDPRTIVDEIKGLLLQEPA